jgi:hypothetical protein
MVPELRFTFANTNNNNNPMYLLLDTGATRSIIDATCVPNTAEIFPDPIGTRTFTTKAGTFTTTHLTKLQLCFPDLAPKRYFNITLHIDNSHRNSSFNAILGRDMLRHIGIGFNFATEPPTIQLDDYNLPMTLRASINHFHPLSTLQQAEKDFEEKLALLPAEYRRADLRSIIPSHLNVTQQNQLHGILQQYSDLFEGKLGSLPGSPVSLQLKPNSTPYHGRAFAVPKIYSSLFRAEVDRLCKLGVLQQRNDSPWAAPSFGIPKKNNQIRFVSDFRQLNKQLIRHPFPLPSIPELMQSFDGFEFCTTLDLNMGYWTIHLDEPSQRIASIVLPWGKYCYLRLPMGLSSAPDIYQEKMATLFCHLDFVLVYLDDLIIFTNGNFDKHMEQLTTVFEIIRHNNLQINSSKSSFCALETEYLGFVLTRQGIKPQLKKVQAILQIAPPSNVKQVRSFVGMLNHYKSMIPHRSHLLTPIINLTKTNAKFIWSPLCNAAFEKVKQLLAKCISLVYPDFSLPFDIYTDASKYQLGASSRTRSNVTL